MPDISTIANSSVQDFLFQRIKENLPHHLSLVDVISEVLHLNSDSAYRRIRGETPLVLEEARQLCEHFHLSLDAMLNIKGSSTLFRNIRVNPDGYRYDKYLEDILNQLRHINGFFEREIIYLTKDIPIFHNFYYSPLIAFRYFFWMKILLKNPAFSNKGFDPGCLTPEIENLSREIVTEYNKVPSTEIWNTECINTTIMQVEFFKSSGYFSSSADIRIVYDAIEETLLHIRSEVENGCKFIPGQDARSQKKNFKFFYNRVILGDNTILVIADRFKTVFLNYNVLNYLTSRDEAFINPCYDDILNLVKKSTQISQTSEKQRNIFFNILLEKIRDRKQHI